jgi:hypothetical protein
MSNQLVLKFAVCALTALLPIRGEAAEAQNQQVHSQPVTNAEPRQEFVDALYRAHGGAEWTSGTIVSFLIEVETNGVKLINGNLTASADLNRVRYEGLDRTVVVANGNETWYRPEDASIPRTPDYIRLWPMLVLAPFQINHPQLKLEPAGERVLAGEPYQTARVMLAPVERAVEWALLFKGVDERLHAIAYQPRPLADSVQPTTPSIVIFREFDHMGPFLLPAAWDAYAWDEKTGEPGAQQGSAKVTEYQLVNENFRGFDKPEGPQANTP